jgi:hypothetical protein
MSMRSIVLSVIVALVLACVGALLPVLRRPRLAKVSPVTAKPLLSRPEQQLYGRLVRAFPGHVVLAQVALSQLLVVDRADVDGNARSIANRFRQLVADFVLCAPDFTAVAVIELDDRSHRRDVQRERDQRKDRFLQAAGIKSNQGRRFGHTERSQALVAGMSVTLPATQLARRA